MPTLGKHRKDMILCGKDDGDSSHSSEPAALDKWLHSTPSLELPNSIFVPITV